MTIVETGAGYLGITLMARFLTLPPGGPWPSPLWLAGIRAGPTVFYQFLAVADVDTAPVAYYTSPLLPASSRFPFGFDVTPD